MKEHIYSSHLWLTELVQQEVLSAFVAQICHCTLQIRFENMSVKFYFSWVFHGTLTWHSLTLTKHKCMTPPCSLLYLILPDPTPPCPTLPYPTLPLLKLLFPTLPYPTLPYPTLPYPTGPIPSNTMLHFTTIRTATLYYLYYFTYLTYKCTKSYNNCVYITKSN